MVDGVDVGHAVGHHAADFFEARVRPHGGDGVALHQDVGAGQQLERFQRRAVGPQDPLPPLDEAVLVPHQVPELDNVGCDAVVEDLDGLRRGHGPRQELDEVPRFEDGGWVEGFARCAHRHRAFDQIEGACDVVGGERARDEWPGGFEVGLAVFGKESCKGRFLGEGAGWVIGRVKGLDLKSMLIKKVLVFDEGVSQDIGTELGPDKLTFHLSMSSVSQGLSCLCVEGIACQDSSEPFVMICLLLCRA